jgi:putative endonuclease
MRHFVYMVECADGTLYTGYTTNIKRRLLEHNGVSTRPGARYTSGRRPVTVVFEKYFMSRGKALRFEAQLKQLSRKEKLALVSG